jgi:lysophospholipase L1-like esterase
MQPGRKLKPIVVNIGLLLGSLLVCLLFLEQVVFRYVLKPDDVLRNVSIDGVVRYEPGTRAVFNHPDGTETLVTVNANGWNSTHPAYVKERVPGKLRVAVIGDSYVHGTFVNVGDGFPEVIERELKAAGQNAEVYRFGMDGAPVSQYLHMLRHEVRQYKPDVVVVQLVHNDFDETYRFLQTRYASSFLKIGVDAAGQPVEIPPADFKGGFADKLRALRTFRYLYYKTNAYLTLKSLVSRYYWGGNEEFSQEWVQSAVDIRKIRDHAKNRFFAEYVMRQMQQIAREDGFDLVFAMDGVREAVYSGRDPASYEVGKLNAIAADLTSSLGLPFLDLQQVFRDDFVRHGERFEYSYDWHWNVGGNRLAGEAIARLLLSRPRLAAANRPGRSERAGIEDVGHPVSR